MFAVILVAGDWILATAFGDRFREGHQVLVILMAGNLSFVVLGLSAVVLVMGGYQRFAMGISARWIAVVVPMITIAAFVGGPTALAVTSALGSTGLLALLGLGVWATMGVRVYPTLRPRH